MPVRLAPMTTVHSVDWCHTLASPIDPPPVQALPRLRALQLSLGARPCSPPLDSGTLVRGAMCTVDRSAAIRSLRLDDAGQSPWRLGAARLSLQSVCGLGRVDATPRLAPA